MRSSDSKRKLIGLLICGLISRLLIGGQFDYDHFDPYIMLSWAKTLVAHPPNEFYAFAEEPDHLPGDLWFLWLIAEVTHRLSNDEFSRSLFLFLMKMVPSLFDIVIGACVYALCPGAGRRRLTWAAIFLFSPAPYFVSAVWGQWDAISTGMLVFALMIAVTTKRWWILCVPPLTWAVLIKPYLLPVAVVIALFALSQHWPKFHENRGRYLLRSGLLGCGLALTTFALIYLPFGVGLPGMSTRWSVLDRVSYAQDRFQQTTMGAMNIWMIKDVGRPFPSDVNHRVLGLLEQQWGWLFFLIAVAWIGMRLVWWGLALPQCLWASTALSYSTVLLLTRMHERYWETAGVFLIIFVAQMDMDRRLKITLVGFTIIWFVNVFVAFYPMAQHLRSWLPDVTFGVVTLDSVFFAGSAINVMVYASVMTLPISTSVKKNTLNELIGGLRLRAPILRPH